MRVLTGKFVQLATGAILGAIIGGIVTGDEVYVLVVAIGIPVVLTVAGFLGAAAVKQRALTALHAPGRPPGIISTMPEVAAATQREAVLNPVSTAQPSAGVVLNGQAVGATATPAPDAVATGPTGSAGWRFLSVVTIVVGAALALIPSYGVIGWIGSDIAAGRPFDGRDMRTGLHQQEAFDQVATLIGSTEVTSIYFYDSYLAVTAPTTPGARTVDRYKWQYGRAIHEGPDYIQPSDIREERFEAGGIDLDLVGRLTRESIADSGLDDIDGIYPSIRRFSGDDPQIDITITNPYFSATYQYSLTGELIQRSGSAFE